MRRQRLCSRQPDFGDVPPVTGPAPASNHTLRGVINGYGLASNPPPPSAATSSPRLRLRALGYVYTPPSPSFSDVPGYWAMAASSRPITSASSSRKLTPLTYLPNAISKRDRLRKRHPSSTPSLRPYSVGLDLFRLGLIYPLCRQLHFRSIVGSCRNRFAPDADVGDSNLLAGSAALGGMGASASASGRASAPASRAGNIALTAFANALVSLSETENPTMIALRSVHRCLRVPLRSVSTA